MCFFDCWTGWRVSFIFFSRVAQVAQVAVSCNIALVFTPGCPTRNMQHSIHNYTGISIV